VLVAFDPKKTGKRGKKEDEEKQGSKGGSDDGKRDKTGGRAGKTFRGRKRDSRSDAKRAREPRQRL
jgi:hypothetical protein